MRLEKEHNSLFKIFFCVCILLVFVLTVYVAVAAWNGIKKGKYIGRESEYQNTISVSATGEVYAKPDLGVIEFSVVTEKKTVEDALSENTAKMNRIISEIKGQGVEDRDLKTTVFNIYPRYEYREGLVYPPSGKRVLVGYEVKQGVETKIRELEKIGDIIEAATAAGANQVGQLSFTVEDEEESQNEARKKAIDRAKEKAELLASQLGVDLVRVKNFSENTSLPPVFRAGSIEGLGGKSSPQVETGENKIESSVTIVYEID